MCELFGVSSSSPIYLNDLLKEFFSHSVDHPHGWGMAQFYGNSVSVEKEPRPAFRSAYLKSRLSHVIKADNMLAHIRYATIGSMDYENCHPFVLRDSYDRCYTLAHNGTMFDCAALSPYQYIQEGCTDSERLLYYIVDRINSKSKELGRELSASERFDVIDSLVVHESPHNKMNFLLYDSEMMYVHTNFAGSLHSAKIDEATVFSTVPLGRHSWTPVKFTTLLAYKNGKLIFTGTTHGNEYIYDEKDTHLLYLDSAGL